MNQLEPPNYDKDKPVNHGDLGHMIESLTSFVVSNLQMIAFVALCLITFYNIGIQPLEKISREFMALRSVNLLLLFIAWLLMTRLNWKS